MLSEAAKARALERGPGFWGFLLAHHWPGQLDRCYRFWLGDTPVWLCARCLGLYPVLLAGLALALWQRPPLGWWDGPWLFATPLPALVDWARGRLAGRAGSNPVRSLTGALLGLGLARTVELNMLHPAHWLVVAQLGGLVACVAGIELLARWRGARSTQGDGR